ncbi:MAG: DUF4080 domain-containing protein [Candidatus Eisenbacteria bacterium]|uniref:DUF4080 domain-containing protein n=1 Tax=Eiseniibacteriota bacterium TaxID=2212470 RepID=A0A948RVH2_UNCEI|nr:DUF4080 domain-containing protein [Candidatus Eisenbacteria bacterium]MBU1951053.1 DUF4080 domain-containing protein [Candidatus Eisenbacteria bacterium]MBU2691775.1 DUF4080 domain-containing protein [Candidatus Eisenbacteria bacterium]
MPDILLATVNARYIHSSLGLRCLLANLGDLRPRAALKEFRVKQPAEEIAEQILKKAPKILGLGVYIWNVQRTAEIVDIIRQKSPKITIVLGGPEASFEAEHQTVVKRADFVIQGEGDLAFAQLCRDLLAGKRPSARIIQAEPCALDELKFPYDTYKPEDIAHRVIYVEASRGCAYRCEFCLSALETAPRYFQTVAFLEEMQRLLDRGARHFKFVDRTFNHDLERAEKILRFFLNRSPHDTFLHLEAVPHRFPESFCRLLGEFPPGSLQLEIGFQTLNPEVSERIGRRYSVEKALKTLSHLRRDTHAYLHTDLIAGLPGEDLDSFARGFDRLLAAGPHEIQVGILKRLRGAPIRRHSREWGMVYREEAPYDLIQNRLMDAATMQQLNRFARFWDRTFNSGRFPNLVPLIWRDEASPFFAFWSWSAWASDHFGRDHSIPLDELTRALTQYLKEVRGLPPEAVETAQRNDRPIRRPQRHPSSVPYLKRQRRHLESGIESDR